VTSPDQGQEVAIIGYGSQGHAHAQNLNDSGVNVTVGLRKDGASWNKAKGWPEGQGSGRRREGRRRGHDPAAGREQPDVYKNEIARTSRRAPLAFAHGFNVHYNQVVPRADLDVIMVAPKGPATPCAPST
jgi:ketol-acid reductoisomerase